MKGIILAMFQESAETANAIRYLADRVYTGLDGIAAVLLISAVMRACFNK